MINKSTLFFRFALFVGNSAMSNDLASLYQVSNVTKELGSVPNPIIVHDSIDVNDFSNVQEFVEKIKASRENRRTVSSYQVNYVYTDTYIFACKVKFSIGITYLLYFFQQYMTT